MISTYATNYCSEPLENIENYDKAIADDKHMWECHHRVETIMNCGRKELIAKGAYWHRPAHELVFLTKEEHRRIHSQQISDALKGRHLSEEHRRKIAESHKGITHTMESRRKMSESRSGNNHYNFGKHLSEETRRRIGAANSKPQRPDIHDNIETIRRLKASGWSQRRIAKHFNCSEALISLLLHR